jgi:tRNA pseudouridine55 synthase
VSLAGLLLIDKPSGPTSHDVVQRIRRALGERSIGHTGTLDPLASGLLPLVVGRATRLASWLTGSDKTYEATITLGFATDTDDSQGHPLEEPRGPVPEAATIADALDGFRGTRAQVPPRHSAKKLSGRKAYDLARQNKPVDLAPVDVTVHELEWMDFAPPLLKVRMKVSAGFYVRALARDLGARLGCGGHISQLRRVAAGAFRIEDAVPLDEAERRGPRLADRLIAPADVLPHLPAVRVTQVGLERARHGNALEPAHLEGPAPLRFAPHDDPEGDPVRILGPGGALVAIARLRDGSLHPVVVLG